MTQVKSKRIARSLDFFSGISIQLGIQNRVASAAETTVKPRLLLPSIILLLLLRLLSAFPNERAKLKTFLTAAAAADFATRSPQVIAAAPQPRPGVENHTEKIGGSTPDRKLTLIY